MDADVATPTAPLAAVVYPEINVEPPSGLTSLGAFASTVPTDPPPPLVPDEKERLRAAARKAEALYPGEVGRFLKAELESWASYGCFRFDVKGQLGRLVGEILCAPLPEPPATAAAA